MLAFLRPMCEHMRAYMHCVKTYRPTCSMGTGTPYLHIGWKNFRSWMHSGKLPRPMYFRVEGVGFAVKDESAAAVSNIVEEEPGKGKVG